MAIPFISRRGGNNRQSATTRSAGQPSGTGPVASARRISICRQANENDRIGWKWWDKQRTEQDRWW